ncbi:MAG: RNA pseudouridine synthase, partial [Clostridia bacterium]|nr:RNA pseudouridine synthase [Clostridia bacterium]
MDELNILHEDNHIIVVLKPQMLACCPDESGDNNLLDQIKEYLKVTYNKAGNAYAGLVHRLDRPTGGVMVFAKTSKAASRLSEQMKNGGFEKRYLAVLCGKISKSRGTLENYLRKNSVNNT